MTPLLAAMTRRSDVVPPGPSAPSPDGALKQSNRPGTVVSPEMVRVVTWIPNRYAAVWGLEAPQDTTVCN